MGGKVKVKTPTGCWTRERCMASARRHKTRQAWRDADVNGYNAACRQGWLDACCGHMKILKRHWTLEECKAAALRYSRRSDWQVEDRAAYSCAQRNGWLEACCSHMPAHAPRRNKWTLEACKASALKFQTRHGWLKGGSGAYQAARRNRWLDVCCSHMPKRRTT